MKKRINHLNPVFYLKNFWGLNKKLWVYSERHKYRPYSTNPIKASKKNEYYGKYEDILEQNYESPFAVVLKNYITIGKLSNDKEKQDFSKGVSHMFSRYVYIESLKKETGNDEALKHALDKRIVENRAQKILNMNWELIKAPVGSYFITSDFPVTPHIPKPNGDIYPEDIFEDPCVAVSFPLSKNICWLGRYNNLELKDLDVLIKNHLNPQRIKGCYKEVYAPVNDPEISELCFSQAPIQPFRNLYE